MMGRLGRGLLLFSLLATALSLAPRARAEIVLGGRDASGNLDNSGVNKNPAPANLNDYEGHFGAFLGTPIASQYFLTANHVGNAGSNVFTFNNGTGTTTSYQVALVGQVGNTDLAVWKITDGQQFSLYAPMYTSQDEVGKSLVSIGNGLARGAAINSPNPPDPGNPQAGWLWSGSSTSLSWQSNVVGSTVTSQAVGAPGGFGGDFLQFSFDKNGGPDTGIFSPNDSGGGTFVFNPTTNRYELAGINSLVGTALDSSGNQVNAALFDTRGFYTYDASNNLVEITGANPVPLDSLATRVSTRADLINELIGVPEPGIPMLAATALGGLALARRRTQRRRNCPA